MALFWDRLQASSAVSLTVPFSSGWTAENRSSTAFTALRTSPPQAWEICSSAPASASAASANASASASSAASSEVSPELKEAAEKLAASADEQAAVVQKAKAAGSYKEFEDEWSAASAKASEATAALKPWVKQFEDGSISDADRA